MAFDPGAFLRRGFDQLPEAFFFVDTFDESSGSEESEEGQAFVGGLPPLVEFPFDAFLERLRYGGGDGP